MIKSMKTNGKLKQTPRKALLILWLACFILFGSTQISFSGATDAEYGNYVEFMTEARVGFSWDLGLAGKIRRNEAAAGADSNWQDGQYWRQMAGAYYVYYKNLGDGYANLYGYYAVLALVNGRYSANAYSWAAYYNSYGSYYYSYFQNIAITWNDQFNRYATQFFNASSWPAGYSYNYAQALHAQTRSEDLYNRYAGIAGQTQQALASAGYPYSSLQRYYAILARAWFEYYSNRSEYLGLTGVNATTTNGIYQQGVNYKAYFESLAAWYASYADRYDP